MSTKHLPAFALALAAVPVAATADPSVGLGLNFTLGKSGADVGVGLRVFSDDEQDKLAASVGLDYMIGSKSLRGSLGAAYLMDDSYAELNGGYDFTHKTFNVGLGTGIVSTKVSDNGAVDEVLVSFACPHCGTFHL